MKTSFPSYFYDFFLPDNMLNIMTANIGLSGATSIYYLFVCLSQITLHPNSTFSLFRWVIYLPLPVIVKLYFRYISWETIVAATSAATNIPGSRRRFLFYSFSSIVDTYGAFLKFSIHQPINSVYFHPTSQVF